MRTMTVGELVNKYNAGERDFSEVAIVNANFGGLNLSGAILKGANLSFSNFRDANINGADLSGANIEWSDFTRADLRNANLSEVRAVWSRFNDAHFGNTNMQYANISWSVFFKADLYGGADLAGANTTSIKMRPEELTEQDISQFKAQLGSLESVLDFDTMYYLQLLADAAAQKVNNVAEVRMGSYKTAGGDGGFMVSYSGHGGAIGGSYASMMGGNKLGIYGR